MFSAFVWNIIGTVTAALLLALFTAIYRYVKRTLDDRDEAERRLDILWRERELRLGHATEH